MGNGKILLERDIQDSDIFRNPKLLKTWIWCNYRANYAETEILFGGSMIKLFPGQFITGRNAMAKELHLSPSVAWRLLKRLETARKVDIKPDNKKSLVTLVNWESLQSFPKKVDSKTTKTRTQNTHNP